MVSITAFPIQGTPVDIRSAQAVDARSKIERLARGPFGRMVINPRRLDAADASYPKSGVEEGETVLTYEGDEARGGPRGRRHRAVVRFAKGGVSVMLLHSFSGLESVWDEREIGREC